MNSQAINSTLKDRIFAFAKAGSQLSQYLHQDSSLSSNLTEKIQQALHLASIRNTWFDADHLTYALQQWSQALQQDVLEQWLHHYNLEQISPKNIGIITAGNIPLVGFHDVLCVIITGHKAIIKSASKDDVLLKLVLDLATMAYPDLKNSYELITGKLENYDAVIATGSNNTARYFEHYFKSVPHIIRKNRNSIAILTGNESSEELKALSDDICRYYGLGCRSVSHLKIPHGYDFDLFFKGMYEQRQLIKNEKYLNNYDYNKAVYLMSEYDLLDNEFFLIKEETSSYSSPIATLGYSYYDKMDQVINEIHSNADQLQCVVANQDIREQLHDPIEKLSAPQVVPFGQTQQPALHDYADGIDTVNFLLTLT